MAGRGFPTPGILQQRAGCSASSPRRLPYLPAAALKAYIMRMLYQYNIMQYSVRKKIQYNVNLDRSINTKICICINTSSKISYTMSCCIICLFQISCLFWCSFGVKHLCGSILLCVTQMLQVCIHKCKRKLFEVLGFWAIDFKHAVTRIKSY